MHVDPANSSNVLLQQPYPFSQTLGAAFDGVHRRLFFLNPQDRVLVYDSQTLLPLFNLTLPFNTIPPFSYVVSVKLSVILLVLFRFAWAWAWACACVRVAHAFCSPAPVGVTFA
jgi:hypothetical protein